MCWLESSNAKPSLSAAAGASFDAPDGGFNLWLELPRNGPTSTDLYLEAIRRGVAFVPGSFFFSTPGSMAAARGLRLSYSALEPAQLRRGVRLLSEALQAHAQPAGGRPEAVVS